MSVVVHMAQRGSSSPHAACLDALRLADGSHTRVGALALRASIATRAYGAAVRVFLVVDLAHALVGRWCAVYRGVLLALVAALRLSLIHI